MTTDVPADTTLVDLDETLRTLLRRELARHGLEVEIAFEGPDKEWSATLSAPTINAFLYDLRASEDHAPVEWDVAKGRNGTHEHRPPLMLEASYALSTWARAIEDEHRLLSQVVAILYAYPQLPDDALSGSLVTQPYPLTTKVAQPKASRKADFWSSIGGTYKASVDYSVTLACESGTTLERGPEVRTQTVRVRSIDGPRGTVMEMHRAGGIVRTGDGEPIGNAWIALPDAGRWTASGRDGRFRFDRLTAGTYTCLVRTLDGREAHAELIVPGHGADVTVGPEPQRAGRKR